MDESSSRFRIPKNFDEEKACYQFYSEIYALQEQMVLQTFREWQGQRAKKIAELLSRISTLEEEVRKIEDSKNELYYKIFLVMYWIAIEEISNKKFTSLPALLQMLGVEDIKYFKQC